MQEELTLQQNLEARCAALEKEVETLREKNAKQRIKIKSLKIYKKQHPTASSSHNNEAEGIPQELLFEGYSFSLDFSPGVSFKERQHIASLITENGGSISYTVNSQVPPPSPPSQLAILYFYDNY